MARYAQVWAPRFDSNGGGIAAFSRELAIALRSQGHYVKQRAKNDASAPEFALRLLATAALRSPDLVICTHPNFSPVAWLAKRTLRIPYAVVAHGIDVHAGLSRRRSQAVREADAVWAVSRWTRQRCVEHGVALDRVRVVGNTVDGGRFDVGTSCEELRRRYAIAADEKVVLTVARLDPDERYKGYDKIVQALPQLHAKLGPVRHLIVGGGDDRARVEQLAAQCGVAESVTFCGFVRDEDLPAHYRLADAFAMPSRGEGFGIVFLEAMACGIPVLGGNRDGTTDALADGELGELVDPDDVHAIAAGLARLLGGQGPRAWFEPQLLREACLLQHGREAFAKRIADAMTAVNGAPG